MSRVSEILTAKWKCVCGFLNYTKFDPQLDKTVILASCRNKDCGRVVRVPRDVAKLHYYLRRAGLAD